MAYMKEYFILYCIKGTVSVHERILYFILHNVCDDAGIVPTGFVYPAQDFHDRVHDVETQNENDTHDARTGERDN